MGNHRRTNRFFASLLAFLCVLAIQSVAQPAARPSLRAPGGYVARDARTIAPGIERFVFAKRRPAQLAIVARFTLGDRYEMLPVIARGKIAGPGRRTELSSAMCQRVRCIVGVNGDFTAAGSPVGGVVAGSEVLRSAPDSRPHAIVARDGTIKLAPLTMPVSITTTYKVQESVAGVQLPVYRWEDRSTRVDAINRVRKPDQIVLYTPRYGPRTETIAKGVEMVVRVRSTGSSFTTAAPTTFEPVSFRSGGNSAIPRDGAVLSGHGAGARALADWWNAVRGETARAESTLTISSVAEQSMGGKPPLLQGGKAVYPDNALARMRAPRTILGWSPRGTVFLVTFDGRQAGWASGVTLAEAASFMRAIGATDALNLDGGGSTAFIQGGKVVNRPSDRLVRRGSRTSVVHAPSGGDRVIRNVERPVAIALAVVRTPTREQEPEPTPSPPLSRIVPHAESNPQRQCTSCSARVVFAGR